MTTHARSRDPLVAIVTPVNNGAAFLAETMESVQSVGIPKLVHIVLDNASMDATPDIIAQYRNRRVPVLTARDPTTLPMVANWSAAVAPYYKGCAVFLAVVRR